MELDATDTLEAKIQALRKAGQLEPAINQFLADNVGLPTLQQQLEQAQKEQEQITTQQAEEGVTQE